MYDKTLMMGKYEAVMVHHMNHRLPGMVYLPHWHPLLEIMVVDRGRLSVTVKNSTYDLGEGDVLVINPGEVHMAESQSDEIAYTCFQIDLFMISEKVSDIQQKYLRNMMFEEKHFLKAIIKSEVFDTFLERMLKMSDGEALTQQMRQLIVFLLRTERKLLSDQDKKENLMYKHSLSQIKPTVTFMREQYYEKITLENLASIASLSGIHYSRVFKQVMYFSPIEFLNQVRGANAVELLLETTMTVAEIAMQIGLNDTNYFSRFFKHYSGMTPTQYRKRYRL